MNFVMSVCPHGTAGSHWTDFHEIWCLSILRKTVEKIQVSLKCDKKNGYFRPLDIFIMPSWVLFKMSNISDKPCRGNQNAFCVEQLFFLRKSCRLWDNVGKYCREGQAKDDNMARAHCMLDNQGYRHARSLNFTHQIMHFYIQVSQEEWTKLREGVPYVELYRYNPKHLYPKLNGYGDNGHRKLWASGVSTYCTPSVTPYSYTAHARQRDVTS